MSVKPPTKADVARGRALFLPDRCDFTLLHCDQPMRYMKGQMSWDGPPNLGYEYTHADFLCDACATEARITVREIS